MHENVQRTDWIHDFHNPYHDVDVQPSRLHQKNPTDAHRGTGEFRREALTENCDEIFGSRATFRFDFHDIPTFAFGEEEIAQESQVGRGKGGYDTPSILKSLKKICNRKKTGQNY